jgi:hypothetical protein
VTGIHQSSTQSRYRPRVTFRSERHCNEFHVRSLRFFRAVAGTAEPNKNNSTAAARSSRSRVVRPSSHCHVRRGGNLLHGDRLKPVTLEQAARHGGEVLQSLQTLTRPASGLGRQQQVYGPPRTFGATFRYQWGP